MSFHQLVNTAQFSYTARDWKKNGGRYTKAPHGSRDYFEFWQEEERRCKYGYKVGDTWIPGRFYDYLNFFPISRVPERVMLKALEERRSKGTLSVAAVEKVVEFPAFWEIHYEWSMFRHISWYGGEFMGIQSPGNKHLCCLKTRGAGWSYIEAHDGVYNYKLIPGSKSYYFAGAEPYLVGDAIMDKVQAGLDWINQYCPYWKQNRQKYNTAMHRRASYIDSEGMERGSFSEIIGQIVDKPSKTRGKRGRSIKFEEGGSFPRMEDAVEVAQGSLREGTIYVGQMSIFGTGGEDGPGIQGLSNIFKNPEAWDMLQFPNVWKDGYQHTKCGYFVPCWRANSWFMDEQGNVDYTSAIAADDIERNKKRKSPKAKDLDRRKAEYPRNPDEALQRMTGNGFNIDEIDQQINRLETDKGAYGLIRYGNPIRDEEQGIHFVVKPKEVLKPIEDFPHSQGENTDLTGCVGMIQQPFKDEHGKVPRGMYRITFDAYAKEESESQESLWSWKLWKLENRYDNSFYNLPVAWCAGRPKRYQFNHERMFQMAELYNADIQGEVAGGGQSVIDYARRMHLLHKLRREPESASVKEVQGKTADNSLLMNMATDRKRLGIQYLEDWHIEPRAADSKGKFILNVRHIYDIAFLREMRAHNPMEGNYDRISDAIVFMYEMKQHYTEVIRERRKTKDFYKRQLYSASEVEESGVTASY